VRFLFGYLDARARLASSRLRDQRLPRAVQLSLAPPAIKLVVSRLFPLVSRLLAALLAAAALLPQLGRQSFGAPAGGERDHGSGSAASKKDVIRRLLDLADRIDLLRDVLRGVQHRPIALPQDGAVDLRRDAGARDRKRLLPAPKVTRHSGGVALVPGRHVVRALHEARPRWSTTGGRGSSVG